MTLPPVRIYEVVREWVTHAWLCEECAARRRTRGWTLRSWKLPPPRQLVVTVAAESVWCDAALEDRIPLRCQDCHLNELRACPTCGTPVIYPGAIGLNPCEDPSHVRTAHAPAEPPAGAPEGLRRKRGKKKSVRATGDTP